MDHPDWYPNWRHDAVHELQAKNERLRKEYRLGDWPRYDYDMEAGVLIFSDQGVAKVIAEIQIAGSTSMNAGNWLWAWGNSHWPQELTTDSLLARSFGEEHGICELMHDYVDGDDLNGLGWKLTAVMAKLAHVAGAYRPPRSEGGGLYVTYKNIAWAT